MQLFVGLSGEAGGVLTLMAGGVLSASVYNVVVAGGVLSAPARGTCEECGYDGARVQGDSLPLCTSQADQRVTNSIMQLLTDRCL